MGGCRCSYSNCTVKSDNKSDHKTHMFHFPIFDKQRCHQWITNAQRLDFLDLKLSQLKNRVICQHHFRDEDFMNHMKGKLKHNAIPTLDGPYCNKKPRVENEIIPINIDDIENEYMLTNLERQATLSVKYGDFLTNDFPEHILLTEQGTKTQIKPKIDLLKFSKIRKSNLYKTHNTSSNNVRYVAKNNNNKSVNSANEITTPINAPSQNQLPEPKVDKVAVEFDELNINSKDANKTASSLLMPNTDKTNNSPQQSIQKPIVKNNKVRILSQKKISEPVKLKGELKTVSPSLILSVPNKKKSHNVTVNGAQIQTYFVNVDSNQQVNDVISKLSDGTTPSTSQSFIQNETPLQEYLTTTSLLDQIQIDQLNVPQAMDSVTSASIIPDAANNSDVKLEQAISNEIQQISIPTDIQLFSPMPNVSNLLTEGQTITTDPNTMQIFSLSPLDVANVTAPIEHIQSFEAPANNQTMTLPDNPPVNPSPCNVNPINNTLNNSTQNNSKLKSNKNTNPNSPLANKTLLKNKMTPEKLAEIERKRNHNKKLRDIIDSCLQKLGDESESQMAAKQKMDKKVSEHLTHPKLPTSQENTIAFLEARLQRMEDKLLNKIDNNSQKIMELKRTIKPSTSKKSAFTQTYSNIDTTKKQLYQQISQFLSPQANSMIYEELFINKFSQKLNSEPTPKKRKKR